MAPLAEMLSVLMDLDQLIELAFQPDEVFGAFDAGEFVRPGAPRTSRAVCLYAIRVIGG